MIGLPLAVIDDVLLEFHAGHILVAAFVLAILATLPLKSRKILALNVVLFGMIFLLTPIPLTGDTFVFRLVGVGLLVVGPMLYATARR